MKPLPALRPPAPPPSTTAPFVQVNFVAKISKLDANGLKELLEKHTGVTASSDVAAWRDFAFEHRAAVGDRPILAEPNYWLHTKTRWFAVAQSEALDEFHVYAGWVTAGPVNSHTHIDLINDSIRWLSKAVTQATPWWARWFWPATMYGSATVAGADSGIVIKSRQSFWNTLFDKDSWTTVATLGIAVSSAILKAGDYSARMLASWVAIVVALTFLHAAVRHWLIMPGATWTIEGLTKS